MKPASVAVVGAGVIGASVAYHLAARGWRDVVLLDRSDGPGEGSTGKATGGFRAQYATAINVRLSLLARDKLQRFASETGVDPGYQPAGYLWLAADENQLATLREGLAIQREVGLSEATEVSLAEIAELNPALMVDEVIGGTFCHTDGFVRPLRLLQGFLAAAERLGVRAEWGVEVCGLERDGNGRVTTVHSSRGSIGVDAVVNAAGPWAAAVAAWAGVELPVVPLRRQVAITQPFDRLPATMPMSIFAGDGFHLRVRDGRVMLLWPTPGIPGRPFDVSVDPEWIEAVTAMGHRRVPVLKQTRVDRAASWAGLYEMSPDKHAILGAAPGCENLFLVNGSSGHGVMHAPALGHLLAEIMSGAPTTLDVSALRPSRFAEGAANPVSGLL
jgi:sarcosine oxidase subunit beta